MFCMLYMFARLPFKISLARLELGIKKIYYCIAFFLSYHALFLDPSDLQKFELVRSLGPARSLVWAGFQILRAGLN